MLIYVIVLLLVCILTGSVGLLLNSIIMAGVAVLFTHMALSKVSSAVYRHEVAVAKDLVTEKQAKQQYEYIAQGDLYISYAAGILTLCDWGLGFAWCVLLLLAVVIPASKPIDTPAPKPGPAPDAQESKW